LHTTLREPPPKGSLRESVLLLYLLKKEEQEYSRDLALVQVQVDKDKGIERFNEYRKTMFPWIESAQAREKDIHAQILQRMVKEGPLTVRPMPTRGYKSRLVKKVEEKKLTVEQRRKQDILLKKLGKAIPSG
jgi:hypothetical protein